MDVFHKPAYFTNDDPFVKYALRLQYIAAEVSARRKIRLARSAPLRVPS
jgi:hypothetical protein